MFNKKEIIELNDDIVALVKRMEKLEIAAGSTISNAEMEGLTNRVNTRLLEFERSLQNKVVATLLEFQKEIYDKLFSSVESLFRYAKEIQLVDTLAHNIKDDDIARVKSVLLKPILEERWKVQNIEKAENINKNILKIVENRNTLLQEKLKLERENRDTKFVSGQLDMLDKIIKESKDEEVIK